MMVEHEKTVQKGKYQVMVLREAIDSFDWESKVSLSVHIKKQYGRYLSDTFRAMEPEQLAHHLEEVILLLAEGEKDMDRWLRKH